MKVAIVGGGICGLSLALHLKQRGIDARVYERTPEIRELGVGITLLPHAMREFSALGLGETLLKAGIENRESAFFNRFGQLIYKEPRGKFAGYQYPEVGIHRGRLHMILYQAVRERLGVDAVVTDCECAGVEQDEFAVVARNHRGDATAIHAGNAADLESSRRKNTARVAEGNERVRLAIVDQFGGAGDGRILFLAQRDDGLVLHFHDLGGVDDADAMVAKAARRQGGVDVRLVADEVDGREVLVFLQGALHVGDDDTAAVVAAHDIHCNTHGDKVFSF